MRDTFRHKKRNMRTLILNDWASLFLYFILCCFVLYLILIENHKSWRDMHGLLAIPASHDWFLQNCVPSRFLLWLALANFFLFLFTNFLIYFLGTNIIYDIVGATFLSFKLNFEAIHRFSSKLLVPQSSVLTRVFDEKFSGV